MSANQTIIDMYRPTIETAPTAYIYDAAIDKVASRSTCNPRRDQKGFHLIGEGLAYWDSRYGQTALYTLSDTPHIASQTIERIRLSLNTLFETDPSFDLEHREDRSKMKPLGTYNYYHEPELKLGEPIEDYEKAFVEFLRNIGRVCTAPEDRFSLVEAIEHQFLPLRLLQRIR